MSRSVNHVASKARKKKILRLTKGYRGRNKNVWTVAKNRWEKGQTHAYVGRKLKKRDYRKLWIQRINAAARLNGMSYSQFIGLIHKNNVALNRKVLADLAMNEPEVFAKIVDSVKN
ncbi:MAG: 50S ribosomal protein L20 [Bacteroidales bacterium]|jgi:large subunit ribosomal protein L20|nr:50S ribosomal protein L20 [Bacteroidales bacterium]MDI9576007.1 50S ribosomal protein L20 [Bacteroidota bacterium]MDD2593623.1 50S ribosomal protein L20 [Bacteroidales bacterium]MDD3755524.1 50S ribosomal protein L20 [Bacteroidales bacterium]MDY0400689.1 50S ribosomal protein L20 [Bacteroidales bacterium]